MNLILPSDILSCFLPSLALNASFRPWTSVCVGGGRRVLDRRYPVMELIKFKSKKECAGFSCGVPGFWAGLFAAQAMSAASLRSHRYRPTWLFLLFTRLYRRLSFRNPVPACFCPPWCRSVCDSSLYRCAQPPAPGVPASNEFARRHALFLPSTPRYRTSLGDVYYSTPPNFRDGGNIA
jgi:hypothetical protein